MKTSDIKIQQRSRASAAGMSVAAAVAVLCISAAGYMWDTRGTSRQNADMAITTLHRSTDQTEQTQAAVIVANEAIKLLDALRTAAARGGESGERAAQLLERLAERARKP